MTPNTQAGPAEVGAGGGVNAQRPRHHEVELHTPHYVEAGEIARAQAALGEWSGKEAALPVDSSEWRSAVKVLADIEGWIFVAKAHGCTRRSFSRTVEVSVERAGAAL